MDPSLSFQCQHRTGWCFSFHIPSSEPFMSSFTGLLHRNIKRNEEVFRVLRKWIEIIVIIGRFSWQIDTRAPLQQQYNCVRIIMLKVTCPLWTWRLRKEISHLTLGSLRCSPVFCLFLELWWRIIYAGTKIARILCLDFGLRYDDEFEIEMKSVARWWW